MPPDSLSAHHRDTEHPLPKPPTGLADFQQAFLASALNKRAEGSAVPYIKGLPQVSAQTRLSIYRGSVYGNLTEALASVYPVVKALVGEDFFDAAMARYIVMHPPVRWDLASYGKSLNAFLAELPALESLPFISDVAQLEWARHEALVARDQEATDLAELMACDGLDPGALVLSLLPGSALISSSYLIDRIWLGHQPGQAGELEELEWQEPVELLVGRTGYEVNFCRLKPDEHSFLACFDEPTALEEALEKVLSRSPSADPGALLANCLNRGWLYRVS